MNAKQAFEQSLQMSKNYTAETMQGAGAIKGDDGFSPTVSVSNITGGHKVTITDAIGEHSFDVMDGNADIAGGTIGIFTLSKDANIQKDSILNVPKSQIVGHTPIKYPGQIYDIYAGIIWQGKEIYFTSFIIQKETGDWNQYYEIKLMSDPKKLTGDSGDDGGTDELLTIKDTVVTNISQLPGYSCCVHAINSEIGFTFKDDIVYVKQLGSEIEVYAIDGGFLTLIANSNNGNLSVKTGSIGYWAKASEVYNKEQVDEKIAEIPTIPTGVIVIWSGTADNVPGGWHICDGTDGTPDLTDKFVLGAGTTHSVGDTGGEETHKLTVEEIPEHYHTVDANASETTSGQMHGAVIIKSDGAIKRASSEVGGNKSHNNMPPYYTLCYIMKVS